MAEFLDQSSVSGRYNSISAKVARAFSNFRRYVRDKRGVLRHMVGDERKVLFGYLPERPAYGLKQVKNDVYNFMRRIEILTDTVDAIRYTWEEQNSGVGTPLTLSAERTGAATFTTLALSGSYYSYQGERVFQVGKDFWADFRIKVSDATNCTLFVGLSAQVSPPDILPDASDRLNSIGFRKDSGDTNIDAECVLGGVASVSASVGTLANDTYIQLGVRYLASKGIVYFWINESYVARVSVVPTVLLGLSFGMRSYSDPGKTFNVHKIVGSIET